MDERRLSQLLHTRGFTLFMMAMCLILTVVAYFRGSIFDFGGCEGLFFHSSGEWITPSDLSIAVNLFCIFGLALLANTLLKTYNPIKALSSLWASMFLVIELSFPSVLALFDSGTVVALILVGVMMILFSNYGAADNRLLFMAFLLLSLGSTFQYAFLFFMPIVFLGMAQVRVLNMKSALAAVLGILTPYWFILGCGIMTPESLRMPHFETVVSQVDSLEILQAFVSVGASVVVGISFLIANSMKMLGYNAQVRAYNGFIALLFVSSILFLALDYTNRVAYITIINFLAAYQICFYFAIRKFKRSYIPVLLLTMLFAGIYWWSVAV